MSNTFSTKVSGKVSSRGWAIALGLGAIVLATILLIVYLDRYRARVSGASAPTPVLLAKQVIQAGTPGTIVANNQMYEATVIPKKEVLEGAIADPTFLTGRAAAIDILPGQQLTATDFAATATTTIDSQITGSQRALSISIDLIHGSLSQLKAGDEVDMYMASTIKDGKDKGKPQIELFRPAVKILAVPGPTSATLILRVDSKDAPKYAFVADNMRLWFVLRPAAGAKKTRPTVGHLDNLIEGRRPK
jgi:Flp pilus assembly protein CpaB